jgi:arylsulfatase A-like enzyme
VASLSDDLSFNTWVGTQFCARLAENGGAGPFLGIAGFVVGETMGAKPRSASCVEAMDARALRQADVALGTILAAPPDNTIIVVTSGRGAVSEGGPMQEEAIKVPLLIRTPDSRAETIDAPVSTMDVAPTLYSAARITPPQRLQGQNLLTNAPRGWAFARLRNPDVAQQTAFRAGRWKLVMSHDPSALLTYHLYDLHNDPDEAHDLATSPYHAEDLEDMIDQMIDARVALEDRTEPRIAKF